MAEDNAESQGPPTITTPMETHTVDLGLTDYACPDPLEKIFQQVEAQNERRAQQEEVLDTLASTLLPRVESSDNLKKSRRRGSISITRFGQLSPSDDGTASGGPMTPALSDIASKSPFFQAQLKVCMPCIRPCALYSAVLSCFPCVPSVLPSMHSFTRFFWIFRSGGAVLPP
ncbi:hypothetical protein B0H16DRAFT_639754 [Mycena metata]|uniref:Uncharacterized protein n=1 Tax=Mycena metata TaxID=1033252 RepID=A0AAD7MCA1_9AGAR|nr:hypothetical protein B0H16DRAFT_639754 [Mycena metata]